jgi:hypothetical protein
MSKIMNASAYHPEGKAPAATKEPKQTEDSDPMVAEFQASTKNDGYTETKYTTPGIWGNPVDDTAGAPEFAPNANEPGDPNDGDDDIDITMEEVQEREKILQQGSDMRQRRGFDKVRLLPPQATDIIANAAFAFRSAWGSGKHPKLVAMIREANQKLAALEIPQNIIEDFQSSSNYQGKRSNPREDYVASLRLEETFFDTVITLAKSVDSYNRERSGKKKDQMLVNVVIGLLGTQPTVYNMGMTWQLITPSDLAKDLEKIINDGLHILKKDLDPQKKEMAENIQEWLAGKNDMQPTVAQIQSAMTAPESIKNCFDDLAKGKNPESHIEQLEFVEQAMIMSNKELGFMRDDHSDLGTDRLKDSWREVQAITNETERKKIWKKHLYSFCLHLHNQGWGCLLDEIPGLIDDTGRKRLSVFGSKEQLFIGEGLIDKRLDEQKRIEWGIGGRPMDGTADTHQQTSVPLSEPDSEEDDDEAIWNSAAEDHAQKTSAKKASNGVDANSNSSSHRAGQDAQTPFAFFTDGQSPNSKSNMKRPGEFTQQGFRPTANSNKPPFSQFSNPFSNTGEEKEKTNGSAFQFGTGSNNASPSDPPFATKPPDFFGPSAPNPTGPFTSSFTGAPKTSTTANDPSVTTGAPPTFKNCTMPGPVGADSQKTELGWIVGGRKFGGHSSRHVVNVGTTKNPVFKVIDGPTFGRRLGPSLVEKYPLPTPKLPYDSTERIASDIKRVCHVAVSAPCANSDRRPVTYYCIKWKSETQDYWLSRSELISFVGKAWLDRKDRSSNMPSRHDQMEHAMENNLRCLQHCKENNLHPDTGKPLLESDRNDTPWLFPISY